MVRSAISTSAKRISSAVTRLISGGVSPGPQYFPLFGEAMLQELMPCAVPDSQ